MGTILLSIFQESYIQEVQEKLIGVDFYNHFQKNSEQNCIHNSSVHL